MLDHDHRLVRDNTCRALGHPYPGRATEALRDRCDEDEVRQVRERAAWALGETRA